MVQRTVAGGGAKPSGQSFVSHGAHVSGDAEASSDVPPSDAADASGAGASGCGAAPGSAGVEHARNAVAKDAAMTKKDRMGVLLLRGLRGQFATKPKAT